MFDNGQYLHSRTCQASKHLKTRCSAYILKRHYYKNSPEQNGSENMNSYKKFINVAHCST